MVFLAIDLVGIGIGCLIEHQIDLGEAEAGELDIEFQVDQPLQFDCEDVAIPARVKRELVVGEDIGAPLGLCEMR